MARSPRNPTGERFGRLLVLSLNENRSGLYVWNCVCDCGARCTATTTGLNSGDTKSCGCLRVEVSRRRMTKHGLSGVPEFIVWKGMKQRCDGVNGKSFQRYGGRGIRYCPEWTDFGAFYADMGPRPSREHSLERLDNDGNYEPGNCEWATRSEQRNNTSQGLAIMTLGDRSQSMKKWADELGANYSALRKRRQQGWSDYEALTRPYRRSPL